MYWVFKNTIGRKPLITPIHELKFKVVFPTFAEWRRRLIEFKVDPKWIEEQDFMFLETMIGNSNLKYKTNNKNYGNVAFKFVQFYKMRIKEEIFYSQNVDELNRVEQENSNTNYVVDRTSEDEVNDNFIDSVQKSKSSVKANTINNLEKIQKFLQTSDPKTKFLTRLAGAITHPQSNNMKGY